MKCRFNICLIVAVMAVLLSCERNNEIPIGDLVFLQVPKDEFQEKPTIKPKHLHLLLNSRDRKFTDKWVFTKNDRNQGIMVRHNSIYNPKGAPFDRIDGLQNKINVTLSRYNAWLIQIHFDSWKDRFCFKMNNDTSSFLFEVENYTRLTINEKEVVYYFPLNGFYKIDILKFGDLLRVYVDSVLVHIMPAKINLDNMNVNLKTMGILSLNLLDVYEIK